WQRGSAGGEMQEVAAGKFHDASRLFDDLVHARRQSGRHLQAECLRGLEIDHQLEPGRLLNRQITRLLALMLRKPITGTGGCCARPASGQAATALPRMAMNSRRV